MSQFTKTTIRRRFGLLLAASVVVGAALSGGIASPAQAHDEASISELVNASRAQNGLGGLSRNAALDGAALNWARQLSANGTLSHNPSVADQIPAGWSRWGENVAQGYSTGAAAHEGWMNSPGHRANILGDYSDIGIALFNDGTTTWGVEVFAKYANSSAAGAATVAAPVGSPPATAPASAAATAPASAAAPAPASALTAATGPAPAPAPALESAPGATPASAATESTPPPSATVPAADVANRSVKAQASSERAAAQTATTNSMVGWSTAAGTLIALLTSGLAMFPSVRRWVGTNFSPLRAR